MRLDPHWNIEKRIKKADKLPRWFLIHSKVENHYSEVSKMTFIPCLVWPWEVLHPQAPEFEMTWESELHGISYWQKYIPSHAIPTILLKFSHDCQEIHPQPRSTLWIQLLCSLFPPQTKNHGKHAHFMFPILPPPVPLLLKHDPLSTPQSIWGRFFSLFYFRVLVVTLGSTQGLSTSASALRK